MEDSRKIPLKTRNKITVWCNNPTTGHITWENHDSKRHVYPSIHCSTIYSARTWKQPRCPSTNKWIKEVVVHTYNGILLIHKEKWIWVRFSEVDKPRACYTEWSKSERTKQISYINGYIWDLEKWYWWTYLPVRNRDTDVENRTVAPTREGAGGTNGE